MKSPHEIEQENLITKVVTGTIVIKDGHKVKGLNPNGVERVVPLSEGQKERRLGRLYQLMGQEAYYRWKRST